MALVGEEVADRARPLVAEAVQLHRARPGSPRAAVAISVSRSPKRCATSCAHTSPIFGMPSPTNRRVSVAFCRASAIAADHVLGALVAHALELDQLLDGEIEQIGHVGDEAGVDELVHQRRTEVLDVHRVALAEELDRARALHRTAEGVGAAAAPPAPLRAPAASRTTGTPSARRSATRSAPRSTTVMT